MRGFDIEDVLKLFKDGAYLWKYQNCSELFAVIECTNCGHRKAIFTGCGLRICPECSKRRARRLFRRYLRIFRSLLSSRKCILSLLTLTVKNCSTILEGLEKLKKGWEKFRRRKYFANRAYGGIFVIEVKLGRDGRYNLHAHILLLHRWFGVPKLQEVKHLTIPERLKYTKGIRTWRDLLKPQRGLGQIVLSILWENIVGDYVVDIRRVRSLKKGLGYVIKYLLKPPKFPEPEHYVEFLEAFWKQPVLIPFGVVRNFEDDDGFTPTCPLCLNTEFVFVCVCLSVDLGEWLKPPPVGGIDYG